MKNGMISLLWSLQESFLEENINLEDDLDSDFN